MRVKDAIKKLEKLNPNLLLVERGNDHDYLPFDMIEEITLGTDGTIYHMYEAWEEGDLISPNEDKLAKAVLMGE